MRIAATLLLLAQPVAAGPVLSVDITLGQGEPYENAIAAVKKLGATATSLSLMWDDLEQTPGTYSPKDDWPSIANIYFPTTGLTFNLTFSVIDTTTDRRPADLKSLPWDDPAVIQRFVDHATAVLTRMPSVPIGAITVGNEVDAALTDPQDIAAYARFLAAVRPTIAALRPGVPFGTKLTFAGLTSGRYGALVDAGDAVFATYYPLGPGFHTRPVSDVPGDIDALLHLSKDRNLWLLEAGYPSKGCDAPPDGQSDFLKALFAATDRPEVRLVSYTFLTDLSEAELDGYARYYGLGDDCFRRYLGSIGLRDNDLALKPAADVFRDLAGK